MAAARTRRILRLVLIVGLFGQIPIVLLGWSLIGLPLALCAALAISTPFYLRMSRGLRADADERGIGALAQLVFFAWWSASLIAGFAFGPIAIGLLLVGVRGPWAAGGAVAVGVMSGITGVTWNRLRPQLRSVDVWIDDLSPSLDGYRIAQLSDLHMGGHTPPERVRRWVDQVNELGPDLIAVTGDLITMGDHHLENVATELGRLRAPDGVAVCLGNHDYFGDTERLVAAMREAGLEVLRNEGHVVTVAGTGARYFLAGVDDTWSRRADVSRSLARRPPELPAIVLAHDPKLFPVCAAAGATLVLSGHTHGGQLALPLMPRFFNIARVAYRHTAGLYREAGSYLYVSRGAGTTGPPVRIGSPSELTILTLRCP